MNIKESITAVFSARQMFDMTPPAYYIGAQALWWYFLVGSLVSLIAYFLLKRIHFHKTAIMWQRFLTLIARYYSYTFVIGLFSLWTRREIIAFFSMPFWVVLMLCLQGGMLLYFAYAYVREFPAHQAKYLANIEKQRYLPKAHKK